MLVALRAHQIFPRQFARSIYAYRSRRIVFAQGNAPLAVQAEYIIGAVMNEDAPQVPANLGQVAHAPGIDGERPGGIAFRLVHLIIGRAIDDHFRLERLQNAAHFPRFGQITLHADQADGLGADSAEESLPQLPVGSEDGVFQDGPFPNLI